MATQGSTILTIGTMLTRAQDQGMSVRALVQGQWLSGVPVAADSHGVVLDNPDEGQYLIRLDAITVVVNMREDRPEPMTAEQEQPEQRRARPAYPPQHREPIEAGPGRN